MDPCIPRKPMHNMDPSATTDTSAYYSLHLCIHVPWTPMHNIDTSTYSRQLLPIVLLVHTTDTWVILVSVYYKRGLTTFMVIICKNMNIKDFLTATKQPLFSLRFVDLVVPVEKINMVIIKVKKVKGLFIVESVLSLSS